MNQIKSAVIIFLVIFLTLGCKHGSDESVQKKSYPSSESMVETNKILVDKDAKKIAAFVKRRNWKMHETETGLWYMIDEKGEGILAKKSNIATINYKISLLDGTDCYSSDEDGPKEFRIGQGGVESGLEEGILLMHVGDKARFIMPPHLAHGLVGDNNRVPARAIIIYEVELIELNDY